MLSSVATLKRYCKAALNVVKGIGESKWPFFFIIFNLVLTKLQDAFYRFLKFKIIFEIYLVKVRGNNRFLKVGAN